MSDDLVERLRRAADTSESGGGEWYQLIHRCREAADRIAELEAESDRAYDHGYQAGVNSGLRAPRPDDVVVIDGKWWRLWSEDDGDDADAYHFCLVPVKEDTDE